MSECARDIIFLIDDDPGIVTALSRLLTAAGFRVEPYTSADDFLDRYSPQVPGCVIIDVAMGDWNGLDLQKRLGIESYDRSVIFISGQSDLPTSVRAMKAGAVDFLTKPIEADDLFRAVKIALARDQKVRQQLAEKTAIRQRLDSLTPREHDVFIRVVEGKPNKQIAHELGIVERTAKVHRARVMSKMAARNITDLVRMSEHLAIAKPDSLA
jgi:FixJ family two-component response regulator